MRASLSEPFKGLICGSMYLSTPITSAQRLALTGRVVISSVAAGAAAGWLVAGCAWVWAGGTCCSCREAGSFDFDGGDVSLGVWAGGAAADGPAGFWVWLTVAGDTLCVGADVFALSLLATSVASSFSNFRASFGSTVESFFSCSFARSTLPNLAYA